MKKIVAVVMFVCCMGFIVAQPVLAANSDGAKSSAVETMLNVNEADQAALMALPGIGKVTAERIVSFRTENGPFKSVDELILVKGIGKKVLEKIRPHVMI